MFLGCGHGPDSGRRYDSTVAEVVGGYLRRAGFEVDAAADGHAALAAATPELPDLVVLASSATSSVSQLSMTQTCAYRNKVVFSCCPGLTGWRCAGGCVAAARSR